MTRDQETLAQMTAAARTAAFNVQLFSFFLLEEDVDRHVAAFALWEFGSRHPLLYGDHFVFRKGFPIPNCLTNQ